VGDRGGKGEAMGQTIKVVCMFCKEKYGTKEGFGQSGVSHGICPKCESAEKCPKCGFPFIKVLRGKSNLQK
jgi:hypothetical protein